MKGVYFMSRKKIYSTELKLQIVQRYLTGNTSLRELAKEYYVDQGDIRKWRDAYLAHGIEGLCTAQGTYSGDFKISVIEYMNNTGASLRQTAAHFNIPSKCSIRKWERIYYEEGQAALYEERRGRAGKVGNKRPRQQKNKIENNEDLLAEVQRLRMENEYLKKLNALVQEREKLERLTK